MEADLNTQQLITLDTDDSILDDETLDSPISFHETTDGLYKIQDNYLQPYEEGTLNPCEVYVWNADQIINENLIFGKHKQRYEIYREIGNFILSFS